MSDIVSLEAFRKKQEIKEEAPKEENKTTDTESPSTNEEVKSDESFDFEAVMKANKEKADRLSKDREKSNKGVKRSYNLRPDDPNNRRR